MPLWHADNNNNNNQQSLPSGAPPVQQGTTVSQGVLKRPAFDASLRAQIIF